MKKRTATAVWNGSGKEGSGKLTTKSEVLKDSQYSYKSRFEEGIGTNPEELIAAAHAGCYAMKLSFVLGAAGHDPSSIETTCVVTLENGTITDSDITVKATVPGMDAAKFQECAEDARVNCPVSKALKIDIRLHASLV